MAADSSSDDAGLRIGLVGPLPPPAGGMATQCLQLCEKLRAEGVQVVLVQTNAPYRPSWVEGLRGLRALFRMIPYLRALHRMCIEVDVIHVLANSGWAWHLFAAPAIWMARWHDVPVIVNYRGGHAESFLAKAPRWVRSTLLAAQARIVPSEFLRQVMARFGISAEIIPNVVDLSRFKPRQEPRSDAGKHVIVTRNLEAIYGIDDVLKAVHLVSQSSGNVRLTIAGEGPERERLLALARLLAIGDKVRFTGRLTHDAVAELYRDADIMVNPSRVDNMPNSILEAYASGVPVVSTNVGGIPFIARDGDTALLVPPHDPEAIAGRIELLINDGALAQRLAQNGVREAQRYSWTAIRGEWMQLYRTLSRRFAAT